MENERIYHLGIKAVIQNDRGEVLILRHRKKVFWDLPGGRIVGNEAPQETLVREVHEETGLVGLVDITPNKMILTPISLKLEQNQTAGLILWYHTCYLPTDQKITLSDEHDDYLWTPWDDAQQLLSTNFTLDLYSIPRDPKLQRALSSNFLSR